MKYPPKNYGAMIEVPEGIFRDLLMRGVRSPLLVDDFFTEEGPVTKNLKEEDQAPAVEEAKSDPFAGLVPGRIVHYHPHPYEERLVGPDPWAAIVSSVSQEFKGQVTLSVFMPEPPPVGTDPVLRLRAVPYGEGWGCWSWIPRG